MNSEKLLRRALEGKRRRVGRGSAWSLRTAFSATLTGGGALAVAYLLSRNLLPRLDHEAAELGTGLPDYAQWLSHVRDWLFVAPTGALILGLASLILRPLRGILAIPALAASLIAVFVVVATLVAALLPLYQMPAGLGTG